MALKLSPIF